VLTYKTSGILNFAHGAVGAGATPPGGIALGREPTDVAPPTVDKATGPTASVPVSAEYDHLFRFYPILFFAALVGIGSIQIIRTMGVRIP
jgi:hypothetical protein